MEISKKQLKQLNELNKKIKLHFPEEYYIFPNGYIFGKDKKEYDYYTMMEYLLNMNNLFTNNSNVIVIYPERLHKLFSQNKDERKIKSSDIGELIIDKNIVVPVWNGEYTMTIGKVVNLTDVNLNFFRSLVDDFNKDFSEFIQLSQDDYDKIYNKELVEYKYNWLTVYLNYKMFKTFTHHCTHNSIALKYKRRTINSLTSSRFFDLVLKFTHVDKKSNVKILDINTRHIGFCEI